MFSQAMKALFLTTCTVFSVFLTHFWKYSSRYHLLFNVVKSANELEVFWCWKASKTFVAFVLPLQSPSPAKLCFVSSIRPNLCTSTSKGQQTKYSSCVWKNNNWQPSIREETAVGQPEEVTNINYIVRTRCRKSPT